MIDIENAMFDYLAKAIRTQFPIAVKAEYSATSATMPCVTIEQKDNSIVQSAVSTNNIENQVKVMFEVNIYTNDAQKEKTAKKIRNYVDDLFIAKGFMRTMSQPTPNLLDATVYRITTRYTATVCDLGNDDYLICK